MTPKRVALKSIQSLTFYRDEMTTARRTSPIPQLKCIGKPCRSFQPEVVQCTNMGDDGAGGVQWKCDTDLPRNIRLGKVHVSCEGWSAAGDKNVLQGSCGLEYNLHAVNRGLEYGEDPSIPYSTNSLISKAFNFIFILVASVILYSFIRSCIQRTYPRYTPPPIGSFFPWGGGGGGGGGWGGGPGFGGGPAGPPPPYSKNVYEPGISGGLGSGLGGFWTGLAAGAAGGYLAGNRGNTTSTAETVTRRRGAGGFIQPQRGYVDRWDDDRGEGSSTGSMRRATGFGGSSTR